ncbi:hypothetical protein B0H14DRAFT_3619921 [Mycena olivaceomarginata]|nr:hypothetical protein B0H14DRAFT_3619921 [Mycena olivaceomarginata]
MFLIILALHLFSPPSRAMNKLDPRSWDHKAMSPWILRCLIKSLSPMSSEYWENTPDTTNTGGCQHHWTNSLTGTKLSLVEAIETARKVDQDVAREIEIAGLYSIRSWATGLVAKEW